MLRYLALWQSLRFAQSLTRSAIQQKNQVIEFGVAVHILGGLSLVPD